MRGLRKSTRGRYTRSAGREMERCETIEGLGEEFGAIRMLQQNLDEEKNADRLLSQIAKASSNPKAVAAG